MNEVELVSMSDEEVAMVDGCGVFSAVGEFFGNAAHWAWENGKAINDGYTRGERI
ncbi:hypothetical protein [Xanthomonas fragariae]|uniref:hypothetical protein n=1 Tax=Xanthomonas fragariae TaxID=48664 RepID=UPI0022AB18E5|nr:hypothetical protein [Xanthomonas fragariae]WAT14453.1 hypothetical protein OZ429_15765 [Xanthomonas fragariae]